MSDREPIEEFKRALTQTMRSIAEESELTVTFGSETPSLNGLRARLPQPSRDLDPVDRQNVRGQSDSFALRLAHHDDAVNVQMMPAEPEARASFAAAEDARCEALGARDMKGIARNLADMHEARCTKLGYGGEMSRDDAPVSEALGFMVRQALTGTTPPPAAQGVVAAWQSWISERIGDKLDNLATLVDDQQAFAGVTRDTLNAGFNEVFFTDVTVPEGNIVGKRGDGWSVANSVLGHERGSLADPNATMNRLNTLINMMKEETIDGRRLIDIPSYRDRLMQVQGKVMANQAHSLRLLSSKINPGQNVKLGGMIQKLVGTELRHEMEALAIDVLGEIGTLYEETPRLKENGSFQFHYMYFLGLIIGGGTNQIQKNIISERGLGMPKEPKVQEAS